MAKGGFPGMGGGANMNNLLKQAQKIPETDGKNARRYGKETF